MAHYKIASPEGAEKYAAEVGATVELELEPGEELAVVAAGWIEHDTSKKDKEAD